MARFYGVGRTFKNGKGGIPARVEDAALIRDSLIQLFSTKRGERVMRPEVGSGLKDLLFESTGPALRGKVRREVNRIFQLFERRAQLLEIDIKEIDTKVIVDIIYQVDGIEEVVSIEQ